MKKIFAVLLAGALVFSLTACGSSDNTTTSEGNGKEVNTESEVVSDVSVEADEKEDITTAEGLRKVVLESPDNNAEDGFWQYFAFENVKKGMPILGNRTSIGQSDKEYTPFYVEPTNNENTSSFVNWYLAEVKSATSDIADSTTGDFVKKIPITDFYDRIGIDISSLTYPDGEEGEVILTEADKSLLEGGDEETIKNATEILLAQNDWMRFVVPEANTPSKEAGDLLVSNFYNINHYNDWCKANNLIYNADIMSTFTEYSANTGEIPLDDAGKESYKAIATELIGYTKNYYDAKYNGAELTAPVSKEFESVAPMSNTVAWLKAQGLTPENTEFSIDSIYANLYYAFPQVIVNYTVTNKDTGMSVHGTSNFIYKIVETENGYSYELDYILETDTDDFKDTMYTFEESLTENSENNLYVPKLEDLY